ncbi:MAG: YHS domain-containing protein [Planctomycetes bacterium]|nr:YHS domain-containing protein [Planctomycetota bacterium]
MLRVRPLRPLRPVFTLLARRAPLVALCAAAVLCGALAARAQEDQENIKDPVCGMTVKKVDSQGPEVYQGQEYYFCMKECWNDFRGEPAKYTGWVATSKKAHGYYVNLFSKPGKILAGEYCRIFLELAPETGSTWKPTGVKGVMTLNYLQQGAAKKQEYKDVPFKPMIEPGFFGTRQAFLNDGYVDAKFTVTFDDGTEEQVPFRFDVLESWDKATGNEYAGAKVKMAVQHLILKKLGRFWNDIEDRLNAPVPDWAKIADDTERVIRYQTYMTQFSPHKHTAEKDEWNKLCAEFGTALGGFKEAVAAKDAKRVRDLRDKIEADNCTKCHLKFRWDTHSDVSAWPDLRGKQTE